MRRVLLLALILAAVGVTLALSIGSAGTETPQNAVARFLQSQDPKVACSQWVGLRPVNRWACVHSAVRGPRATNLVFSHVVIQGNKATLGAAYDYPSNPVTERFSLVHRHGVWLISGAYLPHR
jgi:hypothetical protein